MSAGTQVRYESIQSYLNDEISVLELASVLKVSERQAYRMVAKVRDQGIEGILHGNAGKTPKNKTNELFEQRIKNLIRNEYFDFNMLHMQECLKSDHGIEIKRENLRRICKEFGHAKIKHRIRKKPRRLRERSAKAGFLLQLDGSHHQWVANKKWCLISAIDDATSVIAHCEFFPSEDTLSCLSLLRTIVETHGVPSFLYVDRAGLYGGKKRQEFAEFDRACSELGIKIIYANSPQGKGRIERSFRTLQDRLIPELRRRNIRDLKSANQYLWNDFIPNQWQRFTITPTSPFSAWRELDRSANLESIFAIRKTRVVSSAENISFEGGLFEVLHPQIQSMANYTIEVRIDLNGQMRCFYAGTELQVKRLRKIDRRLMKWGS